MSPKDMIIRAWKDPEYRASLSSEERAALPESPAGQSVVELDEAELGLAVGSLDIQGRRELTFSSIPPSAAFPCHTVDAEGFCQRIALALAPFNE